MKAILVSAIVLLSFGLSACSSTKLSLKELDKIEQEIKVKQTELDKKTQIYVSGAVEALSRIPKESRTPEERLALRLLVNTEEIVGRVSESMRLDVDLLLKDDLTADAKLTRIESESKVLTFEKEKLVAKKEEVEAKIVEEATNIVVKEELKKGFFERIKENAIKLSAAAIALLVITLLFPKLKSYVSKIG